MDNATQEECVHCDGNGTYVTRQGSHMICTWCISDEEAVYDRVLHKMFQKTHRVETDDNGMIAVSKIGDDDLTYCFDCGKPTQRSGLFAEADVYCDECADKHQNEKREQERIRLVDGYPGEWEWSGDQWEMRVMNGAASVWCVVHPHRHAERGWMGRIELRTSTVQLPVYGSVESGGTGELVDVAAAIRPHAKAMVKVLEGMGDE